MNLMSTTWPHKANLLNAICNIHIIEGQTLLLFTVKYRSTKIEKQCSGINMGRDMTNRTL